jgi:hypothetical protein
MKLCEQTYLALLYKTAHGDKVVSLGNGNRSIGTEEQTGPVIAHDNLHGVLRSATRGVGVVAGCMSAVQRKYSANTALKLWSYWIHISSDGSDRI